MFSPARYQGGVFHESIEGGRSGAEIEPTATGVKARTATGQEFFLSYGDCVLEMGGASGRMLFCRMADRSLTIFSEDRRFLVALETASRGFLADRLDELRRTHRSRRRRAFYWSVTTLVVIVGLVVGGYYAVLAAAHAAVRALPREVDQQIGEVAFQSLEFEGEPINDPAILQPIEDLVQRMAPHTKVPQLTFRVHLIDSPTTNAIALPGGQIIVFSGLIQTAKSPEQLAGVLAHEMSHVVERHGLQQVGRSIGIGTAIAFILGDAQQIARFGADVFMASTINRYSREQEMEADLEGARLLHAAGINPHGMIDFFKILHDQEGDLPGVLSWTSTHPQHGERIAAIRAEVERMPKQEYIPLPMDWAQLQQQLQDK